MFTGLIKAIGTVAGVGSGSITVDAGPLAGDAAKGDSIAVDGICLTVTAVDGPRLTFDVSDETRSRTTAGRLRAGSRVNLEDALTPSARIGGHFVLGHVDGIGRIVSRKPKGQSVLVGIRVPESLAGEILPRGSVAVDGISLTVNELRGTQIVVNLVPHTRSAVTLEEKRPGDEVNIETDLLVKAVMARAGTIAGTAGLEG
jgi:riboflavin synthase